VPAPLNVNTPVFAASPKETDPPIDNAFTIVRPAVESLDTVPPANVNDPVPNAALSPTRTAPAVNTAPPLNVFGPPSVNAPTPAFVNENAPPNTPPNTTSLATVTVVSANNTPAPSNDKTPEFTKLPNPTAPLNSYPFAKARSPTPTLPELETVAPSIVSVPVPNAASFPTKTLPAKISAPPVNVLAPPSVNSPDPVFLNTPEPLITPE
jgi:hypothetical protein